MELFIPLSAIYLISLIFLTHNQTDFCIQKLSDLTPFIFPCTEGTVQSCSAQQSLLEPIWAGAVEQSELWHVLVRDRGAEPGVSPGSQGEMAAGGGDPSTAGLLPGSSLNEGSLPKIGVLISYMPF